MNTCIVKDNNAKYNSFEELVADLHFLEYVRNGIQNESLWKHRIPEGQEEWIKEAREIVEVLHFEDRSAPTSKKRDLWKAIEAQTLEDSQPARIRSIQWTRWAAAAAIILAAWTTWTVWMSSPAISVTTDMAEMTSHTLPDASKISLNADSKISYNKETWENQRQLSLEGEAFFEVTKGESFVVNTQGGSVEVLGTSFNVISRENMFEVACYTGKVRVEREGLTTILTPGAKVAIVKGLMQKVPFQVDLNKSWMEGYFIFNGQPLSHVLQEIERQFDVQIQAPNIDGNMSYNGFFTKENLTQALQAVCWPLRLRFAIDGREVNIYKEE